MSDVAVVVPTLGRPHRAAPFIANLRATANAAVYAVAEVSDSDSVRSWHAAGATVLLADGPSYAVKVNLAYRSTEEPWLFLAGDDVRFWPAWLDALLLAAADTGAKVVGSNDLGSPRVRRGVHATHMLIARSYIDEVGASWDGPKVVCHEGYRHWFCDDEIMTAAKQRQVAVYAPDAWVEHKHPVFNKAKDDPTYALVRPFVKADRALFAERLAANT